MFSSSRYAAYATTISAIRRHVTLLHYARYAAATMLMLSRCHDAAYGQRYYAIFAMLFAPPHAAIS